MEEVYPSERVNCHMVPEDDCLVCEKVGTCKQCLFNISSLTFQQTSLPMGIFSNFLIHWLGFPFSVILCKAKILKY